jgi:tripartite-type tricarboxylate transporter receptor subunit TctC
MIARSLIFLGLATMLVAAVPRAAAAQTWPDRPLTMVVPFPPGGPTDALGRILSERMGRALGQSIIVDNVSGAGGTLGVAKVARAAADGYTLSIAQTTSNVFSVAVYNVPYDVLADFEPVAPIATTDLVVVARKAMPADDLKGLIAWLKANPDKATQGSGGPGSLTHLAGIFFQKQTGTRFAIVPYRGAGAAITDLVAGHLDIMFDLAPNSLPHMRAGAIKSYAVMAKTRLRTAPGVPTVDEAGLPGLYMATWEAIWVPKGTPADVVARLNAAVVDALSVPAVTARLAELGHEVFPRDQQTPASLAALHKAELGKWWPVIKAANVTAE